MDEEKKCFQKAFRKLKPACDAFMTNPDAVNANLLKNALVLIPGNVLEQFHPYILIPLEINLKSKKCV